MRLPGKPQVRILCRTGPTPGNLGILAIIVQILDISGITRPVWGRINAFEAVKTNPLPSKFEFSTALWISHVCRSLCTCPVRILSRTGLTPGNLGILGIIVQILEISGFTHPARGRLNAFEAVEQTLYHQNFSFSTICWISQVG